MAGPTSVYGARIPRRFQRKISSLRSGVVALILVTVATSLAFSKELPWREPFQLKAVFESANDIRLDSPVRIAGVEIGEVTKVEHLKDSDQAVVTMEVTEDGLPIHEDATLKIRPRLFLEGNFFVDMKSGTPEADTIGSGDTIPVTQTAYPVQLDQILTALQSNTRKDLQELLEGFGTGLTHEPTAAEDADQDADVRGEIAAQALNDSLTYSGPAFKNAALVNQALLGTDPNDLRKLVAGLQKVFAALDRNEEQLKDFFTNFSKTMAALAAEQSNLRRAVHLLGPTIEQANISFGHLAEALPPTRAFVRAFIPGVKETGATIRAAGPWLTQFTALVSKTELGGLLSDLRPMTASFAKVVYGSIDLYRQTDLVSRCFSNVVLPAGDQVVKDGNASTGAPSFKEFWYSVVGLSGESQNFDGNGQYTRVQTGGGPYTVKSGKVSGAKRGKDTLYGNSILPPLGTRPKRPPSKPPVKPDFPCYKNPKPDLNGPGASVGAPDARVSSASSGTSP